MLVPIVAGSTKKEWVVILHTHLLIFQAILLSKQDLTPTITICNTSEEQTQLLDLKAFKNAGKILTLDNPIPSGILDVLPNKSSPEFTEMRYVACTSDPDSFVADGSLRFSDMNREMWNCVYYHV